MLGRRGTGQRITPSDGRAMTIDIANCIAKAASVAGPADT